MTVGMTATPSRERLSRGSARDGKRGLVESSIRKRRTFVTALLFLFHLHNRRSRPPPPKLNACLKILPHTVEQPPSPRRCRTTKTRTRMTPGFLRPPRRSALTIKVPHRLYRAGENSATTSVCRRRPGRRSSRRNGCGLLRSPHQLLDLATPIPTSSATGP